MAGMRETAEEGGAAVGPAGVGLDEGEGEGLDGGVDGVVPAGVGTDGDGDGDCVVVAGEGDELTSYEKLDCEAMGTVTPFCSNEKSPEPSVVAGTVHCSEVA